MRLTKIISLAFVLTNICFAQQDSDQKSESARDSLLNSIKKRDSIVTLINDKPQYVDSLDLIVKDIIITGNDVTKDEIILREMQLKKNKAFTSKKYEHDLRSIYNLRLFLKVDIIPIPVSDKEVVVNVDVQEKWYILPLPHGGLEEGEWKKLWVGLNLRWENFRGRNETVSLSFRVFYNPAIRFSYSVPWIGEKAHLYSSIGFGYEKTRNQSLEALGKPTGGETIRYNDSNFDYFRFNALWTIGKYITDGVSLFTDAGYDYLRVSQYAPGRTLSPAGKDKYITLGAGLHFDSRDIYDFATKGYYIKTSFTRYGFIDKSINFGRFNFESQSFIPFYLSKKYYITLASRLYTSQSIGAVVPLYNHEFLGYGENYVRGWKNFAYEGENVLTSYNEMRIPIFQPDYIKADKIAILRDLPIVKKLELKHGLYFTMFYDIGSVWNNNDNLRNVRFRSGAGIGLDFILAIRIYYKNRLGIQN